MDLKDLDTSGVTDMSSMFLACDDLTTLDLSSFDTAQAEMEDTLFHGCEQPVKILAGGERCVLK